LSCPIYEDFYPKALIPIGRNDQSMLSELKISPTKLPEFVSHWQIALEGEVIPNQNKFYHWKVSIYPSNKDWSFVWDEAIFSSSYLLSVDEAMQLAKTLENHCKSDELFSKYLLEKIS
jgi:hypothetical protein